MEDLLKEKNLTLDTTLTKCRAHEAAKRQRAELVGGTPESSIHAMHRKQQDPSSTPGGLRCPGHSSSFHPGGRRKCPAYQLVCHLCHRTGHLVKVCRSVKPAQPHPQELATNAVHITPSVNTSQAGIQPAPTIQALIPTCNGSANVQLLPDSGVDISVAGSSIIQSLEDHPDNLLPSPVTPRTVNGQKMTPIGKLPVQVKFGNKIHKDELHIYPNVEGTLISWKTCMALSILPPSRHHLIHNPCKSKKLHHPKYANK